ncbi:MAG: DUF1616 domain-containing protein [Methanomassiliicoccales archaeon]|nr:DUF1616 domain-containing protein [Methanomassiliicoccales archaeon]
MRADLAKHWDLITIVILTLILVPIIYLLPDNPMRIVIGLPFILFFPGYALIATLFPEKKSIDIVERIALSFGLSIAVTPLIGLGLNYTPFGIRLDPILASIGAFNIIFSAIAFYRRKRAEDPFLPIQLPPILDAIKINFRQGNKIDRALNIILVISIAASLVALVYVIAVPKQGEKFTEFYILGPDGKAHNYPTNLTVGENATLIIGIANHEYREVNYAVEIWLVDSSFVNNTTIINHMYFFDSFSVTLAHMPVNLEGNWTPQWELRYNFSLGIPGQYKMWFLLFKDQMPFEGIRYQDYVNSGMESKILDAVEGKILSLNLSMNVKE